MLPSQEFTSVFVTAPDGLTLHVRSYGSRRASPVPVVCLPGFARTAADFHPLAAALATDPSKPRQVFVLDHRGHGQSAHDRNPSNYTLSVAFADLSAVLTALEIAPAIFIGTSWGGLLAVMLAVSRPTAITGVILHDIGPDIGEEGLLKLKVRIKGLAQDLPTPRNFEDGAEILHFALRAHYPKLTLHDWLTFAQCTWREVRGKLVRDNDPKLVRALESGDVGLPPMQWSQFDVLAGVPVMVVRGANSDILASTTLNTMLARRGELEIAVVPDQGHPPLLLERSLIRRIVGFVGSCDGAAQR